MASDEELARRMRCDAVLERAAEMMGAEVGASPEMIIDRIMTFGVAQMVHLAGKAHTIATLRRVVEQVEHGVFNHLEEKPSTGMQ